MCLDAFTSNITLDVMNNFGSSVVMEREKEKSDRIFKTINKHIWQQNIIDSLKQGKKVFIFYPYLNMSKCRKRCSMMEFKNILENETGRRGIMYNSLVDDNVNVTLYDVNSTWSQYDL